MPGGKDVLDLEMVVVDSVPSQLPSGLKTGVAGFTSVEAFGFRVVIKDFGGISCGVELVLVSSWCLRGV